MMDDERKREKTIPEPLTPEEIVAWSRRELPEDEADRMRERLAYYPDLAAALSGDDAPEDEAPILTREQLAHDWEMIEQRLRPTPTPQPPPPPQAVSWGRWLAVVPTITTLLFAGLWARSLFTIDNLNDRLHQPKENVERLELYANSGARGGASPTLIVLQPSTEHVLLTLNPPEETSEDATYRVALRDLDGAQPVEIWSHSVPRAKDGTFSIEVPRTFLASRSYEIDLYSSARTDPIATYSIFVAAPR